MAGEEEHDPDYVSRVWFWRAFYGAIAFAVAAFLVVTYW